MKTVSKTALILLLGILIINNQGFAQPILEWSKNYGGSNADVALDMEKTADGGYIIAGWSDSNNGDVGGNNGGQDAWIVKLDKEGDLEWERNYGGSDDDVVYAIRQTTDDGFIVAGYARSADGDVGGNNGGQDAWIIKLDKEGNLEWTKNYGGSDNEVAVDIVQTSDNGYALSCNSQSNDGDVGGNNGEEDYWIVKLDSQGTLEWAKNYGGSDDDTASAITQTTDNGYMLAGSSRSNDGDVGANEGSNDIWILKLDDEGIWEWKNTYGGSENDVANDMEQTMDGGFIFAGRSRSNDGDASGNNGGRDGWIFKLDNEGNLEWAKSYGGSDNETASSVKQTIGGEYIVAGHSESNDGDVGGNYGNVDSWVIKLDHEGSLEWSKNYGGSESELASDIVAITDDEFIISNWSHSNDGDLAGNNGDSDMWFIKITSNITSTQTPNIHSKVTISPNPSNGECLIDIEEINTFMSIRIFDTMGCSIYTNHEVNGPLSIVDLPKGNYFIQIVSDEFSITKKLIVF